MPPAPARRLSRRAAAALPAAARAAFLLDAARDPALLGGAPGLAFHLAGAALKVAATARIPLARGSTSALCPSCGAVLGACDYGAAAVVTLRSRARRRARARAVRRAGGSGVAPSGAPPTSVNQAALVITCASCGQASVRPFFTAEVAHAALARLREGC